MGKIDQLISEKGYVLADGATGTNLFSMGLESGDPPELWNREFPDRIYLNHQNFITAGSDLILTNTFGANKFRLALHNAEDLVHELNVAGAEIAHKAADRCERTVIVAGSIGPTGEIIEPLGELTKAEATSSFVDQAIALKEGGVDVAWIESMYSEEEIECAITASKEAGLPILLSSTFDSHGKSMMGHEPKQLVELAERYSPEIIGYGANCGIGASELIGSILCLAKSRNNQAMHLVAKANCGIPEYRDGEIIYNGTAEIMASYACYARKLGATIIGGCCGTKQEHIKAMADALEANEMDCPIELDEIIKSLGEMTKGNMIMIEKYLNLGNSSKVSPVNPRRKRRRRSKN